MADQDVKIDYSEKHRKEMVYNSLCHYRFGNLYRIDTLKILKIARPEITESEEPS